jgi:putative membrane protein
MHGIRGMGFGMGWGWIVIIIVIIFLIWVVSQNIKQKANSNRSLNSSTRDIHKERYDKDELSDK